MHSVWPVNAILCHVNHLSYGQGESTAVYLPNNDVARLQNPLIRACTSRPGVRLPTLAPGNLKHLHAVAAIHAQNITSLHHADPH